MEIPVFVEPIPTGFRATTGSPLPLTADGPTADAAVAAVQELLAERLRAGGQLRTLSVKTADELSAAGRASGVLTPQKVEEILTAAQRLASDPLFDDWVRAVEEYRREHNTVPDPD
jgi:hypothetical protein